MGAVGAERGCSRWYFGLHACNSTQHPSNRTRRGMMVGAEAAGISSLRVCVCVIKIHHDHPARFTQGT